ncbi:hypothetical protein [Pantoea sp.]|uniref:hypothetical protein n=1 Tax=Pantoea sp. TaxID=69393 RepID=UPI0028ACE12A|nr:hypothetical protein [Pantoea sp.]
MSLSVSMTSAEIAALVNKYDDLKSAVLAKYLSENTPELVITDLVSESASENSNIDVSEDVAAADVATA